MDAMREIAAKLTAHIRDICLVCNCGQEFSAEWRSNMQELTPSRCPRCGKELLMKEKA